MKRRDFLKSSGTGIAILKINTLLAAPNKKRPNFLFFFPDQHRFDWTSMNPDLPDITPNLKKLAGKGVHFTNAFSPSPVSAPSRACLASGREYAGCGVKSNGVNYPLDRTTFYTRLKNIGYHVLGCGKFDLSKPNKNWGPGGKHNNHSHPSLLEAWGYTDGIDNAGKMDGVKTYKKNKEKIDPYLAFLEKNNLAEAHLKNFKTLDHDYAGKSIMPDNAYADNWIASNGLKLIRSVPKGRPWFIQINFNGPHPPMDITKSMYELWKDKKFPLPRAAGNGKKETIEKKRRNYGAMIYNIDSWLKVFQKELIKRNEMENTVIVYCSDHGEMLYQRGLTGKSKPYHPSVCVPLVISGPGIRKNISCKDPVETLDLTATFLDYAGINIPDDIDSRSLKPYLEGKGNLPRKYAVSSLKGWALVFDGKYKLITSKFPLNKQSDNPDKEFHLYDLEKDTVDLDDISDKHPDIVEKLKKLLPPVNPYKMKEKKKNRKGK